MTGKEYAALQGAQDFKLDSFSESQIQYAFGDAVAVPAVEWLMKNAVIPALRVELTKASYREAI
jgi:DNA (cytosine-5)-methyltransferase 1